MNGLDSRNEQIREIIKDLQFLTDQIDSVTKGLIQEAYEEGRHVGRLEGLRIASRHVNGDLCNKIQMWSRRLEGSRRKRTEG